MNLQKNLALFTALFIPVVFDVGLIADSFETNSEVLITKEEKKELGLDDIDRLIDKVEKEEKAGNYQQAIEILEKILVIEQRELGPEHGDVGATLVWIGLIHIKQGHLVKTEETFLRALAIQEKTLGVDDPEVASTLVALGDLYQQ